MNDNPIVGMASKALGELIEDEPLGTRVREALKQLQPILGSPQFVKFDHREVIVGAINKANEALDEYASVGSAAESVAEAIEIIFRTIDPLPAR
ncbi:MAG: hypothetical protein QOH39_2773 [Verrucomicrobiota bacterium]|jgi:hypothetical protein